MTQQQDCAQCSKIHGAPVETVLLLTTNACTLNCTYCYMKQGGKLMSKEVALRAVDWALENSEKKLSIEFFGGDPLLNLAIMEPTMSYAMSKLSKFPDLKRFWFTAFVNGYNPNLKKFLDIIHPYVKTNNFHLQFSMDGCRESQDTGRRTPQDTSSFDEVVKQIKIVKKRLGKVQIHCVMSAQNIQYLNKNLDFLLDMGCNNLEFGIERSPDWDNVLDITNEQITKMADRYIKWMKEGRNIQISLLCNPIHTIIKGKTTGCYIGNRGFLVGHDGAIYPCQRFEKFGEEYRMGDIYQGIVPELVELWGKVDCHNMQGCRDCTLYGMCLGSCVGANLEYNHSLFKPIHGACQLYKIVYRESLRIYEECKDNQIYIKMLERLGARWGNNVSNG